MAEYIEDDADMITVCDKCLTATCWHGIFMCRDARDAGIKQMSRGELLKLDLEHPSYLKTDEHIAATGGING